MTGNHLTRRRFMVWAALSGLAAACSRGKKRYGRLPAGSTVLALGDSLTFGYGAAPEEAYPVRLAALTGWNVINGGVSGDTSAQALARLPELLRRQPKLVLLGIGGNDFLRSLPESETRRNIAAMLGQIRQAGAQAVLIAVPRVSAGALFGSLSDHPLYAQLAREHDVPLLAELWSDILGDSSLKSDAIHANGRGYAKFAEEAAAFLQQQGFR